MITDALFQLLGLVCVSGNMVFVALLIAAALRVWLERLAQNAADSASD